MCFRWDWPHRPSAPRTSTRLRFGRDDDPGKAHGKQFWSFGWNYREREILFLCCDSNLTNAIWWKWCYVTSKDRASAWHSPWITHSGVSQLPYCQGTHLTLWKGVSEPPWKGIPPVSVELQKTAAPPDILTESSWAILSQQMLLLTHRNLER